MYKRQSSIPSKRLLVQSQQKNNQKKMLKTCSKLTIKTMTVLYLNYILFINYTYCSSVSTVKFEQVNADW